jgi:dTMP kinase
MASRGVFILFEGIDRCGKTTQANMLTKYLGGLVKTPNQGNNVEFIRFPDRTSTIGQMINSYLVSATNMNDNTIHLLFSANRWEASQEIERKLNAGCNLVCDRYAYSGVAFSSAKGLDLEWCKACDIGLPAPDCVIYLDMPVEEAAGRGQYGEERYEKVDFQLKVREKFMQLKNGLILLI